MREHGRTVAGVTTRAKLLARLLEPAVVSIRFDELVSLLRALGFQERIRGSHHIFSHPAVPRLINLQRDGSRAKKYQVQQVRKILIQYGLVGRQPTEEP